MVVASRLYAYQSSSDGIYEHGRFVDLGGSALVPGFGGQDPNACHPGIDKNGMVSRSPRTVPGR